MPANNKQQEGHRAPQALVLTGIALTTVAYFLFTLHDAAVKWLVTSFAVWQILFIRSLTILVGCLLVGGSGLIAARDIAYEEKQAVGDLVEPAVTQPVAGQGASVDMLWF